MNINDAQTAKFIYTFHLRDVLFNFSCATIAVHRHLQNYSLQDSHNCNIPNLYTHYIDIAICQPKEISLEYRGKNASRTTLGSRWKASVLAPSRTSLIFSTCSTWLFMRDFLSRPSSSSCVFTQTHEFGETAREKQSIIIFHPDLPVRPELQPPQLPRSLEEPAENFEASTMLNSLAAK